MNQHDLRKEEEEMDEKRVRRRLGLLFFFEFQIPEAEKNNIQQLIVDKNVPGGLNSNSSGL